MISFGWGNAYQSAPDPFRPQVPQGGGWLGALGNANYPTAPGGVPGMPGGGMGGGGMTGFEKLYLGASAAGGVADWWERRKAREEEQRRYEQELRDREQHRRAMGANLSTAWGG